MNTLYYIFMISILFPLPMMYLKKRTVIFINFMPALQSIAQFIIEIAHLFSNKLPGYGACVRMEEAHLE